MTLESLSGKGWLYADAGGIPIAEIKYQIVHTLPVGRDPESWHGTFTTPYEVVEHEAYYVQLEDLRHSPCALSMGTRAMGGIPAVYHYSFKGVVLALPGTAWIIPTDTAAAELLDGPDDISEDESRDESWDESWEEPEADAE
jgi:hypothetical protein